MKDVMSRLNEHLDEALTLFPPNNIVGIFLQGSQNYGLEIPTSDVDTKLIVTPSFENIALNKRPVSTTHVRANNEHIDLKDIRLYMQTFQKQNLNFLEILFTKYNKINELYADLWTPLMDHREEIAHMNPYRALKSMKGVAMEKWHAMEHEYESKREILAKFGYDPKQLHHLLRVEDFIERYLKDIPYEECLRPEDPGYLLDVKIGVMSLDEARKVGQAALDHVCEMADEFCDTHENVTDPKVEALLEETQIEIMKRSIKNELLEREDGWRVVQ